MLLQEKVRKIAVMAKNDSILFILWYMVGLSPLKPMILHHPWNIKLADT
jgi:hypothetical protein